MPTWQVEDFYGFTVPSVSDSLYHDFDIPNVTVTGYEYDHGEQPVYIELWIEKSTMNDVLHPLCERLRANLVTSAGFQSITAAVNCLSRAAPAMALGRAVRIFYISDFDPAGESMPVSVARQIEFWKDTYGQDCDIKLQPVALTRAQVDQYQLPRVPIKASDKRKGDFEDRNGAGAVELDALEALHPGVLAQIVGDAVRPYRDDEIEQRLSDADYEASLAAREQWESMTADLRAEATQLNELAENKLESYRQKLAAISEDMRTAMEPVQAWADDLEERVQERVDSAGEITLDLPVRPTANVTMPDESDFLFDSSRTYTEQLEHYRRHKGHKS